jgi:hypothetical protein
LSAHKFSSKARHRVWRQYYFDPRMMRTTLSGVAVSTLLVGCWGYPTTATNVTSNSATVHATVSCSANTSSNPCTAWFQYWNEGASLVTQASVTTFNHVMNSFAGGGPINGLAENTLYHYQLCGYGDDSVPKPGLCIGPHWEAAGNSPGQFPDHGDLSATENFRTASATTAATVDLGRVLSTADVYSDVDHRILRDAGISVQYSTQPAQSLWLFGDTVQRNVPGFIAGTTAAIGAFTPGEAPRALNELPTPPTAPATGLTAPARFFPVPTGLKTSSNANCGANDSYPASWPAGGAKEPGSSKLMLMYGEVCVTSVFGGPVERLTLTEYDPAINKFTATYSPFVASPMSGGLPSAEIISSPVFGGDGYLYFYYATIPPVEKKSDGTLFFPNSAAYVVRVSATPSKWGAKSNYKWRGQLGWGAESAATPVISGFRFESLSVGDYSAASHKYVMLVQTSWGPAFSTYEAAAPTGPWTKISSAQLPDVCNGGNLGCYALAGHPELSTAQQFVYSWLSTDDLGGGGHLRVGAVNW